MKALFAYGIGDYRLEDTEVPVVGPKDILIQVEACGICAGDLKASHGAARFWGGSGMGGYCEPPFIPGHEFYGRIVAMGEDVPGDFAVGERIISEQIVPCGSCRYCKEGKYWLCDPHDVYGFKNYLHGGMAEYALLPHRSVNHRVPESFSREQAVLIEPYACALHGVRQAEITVEDIVVLAGAGTLGLGMVGAVRQRNPAMLIVLDMDDRRLAIAQKFGADKVINPGKERAVDLVLEWTDGYGCDTYIEVTGHPSAVEQGLEMIRKGGRFVEFSVFSGPSTVDWSIIGDTKEITIQGSQLSPYCFPPTIRGIADGTLPVKNVVTHFFPLEKWAEAFATAGSGDAIKVAIEFEGLR